MQGYQVKFEDYRIDGRDYRIRSLRDRQQYPAACDEGEHPGVSAANWPLFGVIWPSGQMLARHMSTYAVDGLRILEVGCGLALASIVLRGRGADITASDHHPMVPSCLAANLALNELRDIDTIAGEWASEEADPELFDLIIGADLLYERDHCAMLSAFIDRHAKPVAEVIIVDPGRGYAGKFGRRMQTLGYSCTQERSEMQLADHETFAGRIVTCRRDPGGNGVAKGMFPV
jgi:predicted nicotinamide N-methyase